MTKNIVHAHLFGLSVVTALLVFNPMKAAA